MVLWREECDCLQPTKNTSGIGREEGEALQVMATESPKTPLGLFGT